MSQEQPAHLKSIEDKVSNEVGPGTEIYTLKDESLEFFEYTKELSARAKQIMQNHYVCAAGAFLVQVRRKNIYRNIIHQEKY